MNQEQEHLLQLDINVIQKKTKQNQATGLAISDVIGNPSVEVLTFQGTGRN